MRALSVSQLNRQIKNLLEQDVGDIYVGGEISNLSKPASGHFYFTMKDESAQIRCVFFKNRQLISKVDLANGQKICAHGRLSLYEARGDYQLIIEQINEDGLGDLNRLFELLKTKLQALGLFDNKRKKPLPKFPNCIGVVTSSSGAALKDILATLDRRYPFAKVLVYPSDVQGKGASEQLIAAILRANIDKRSEVLILARGGGSLEDLWAFNDEKLAHVIAGSEIPIVSGVGHEIDFTIADFVADLRAATPTAAAEACSPNTMELLVYINNLFDSLLNAMHVFLQKKSLLLKHELTKLSSPERLIRSHWQKLDYLDMHLYKSIDKNLLLKKHALQLFLARLNTKNPRLLLAETKARVNFLEDKLLQLNRKYMQNLTQHFKSLLVTLHALSPLATLDRGYAIVMHEDKLVYTSTDVSIGSQVEIKLANGQLVCEVLKNAKN